MAATDSMVNTAFARERKARITHGYLFGGDTAVGTKTEARFVEATGKYTNG